MFETVQNKIIKSDGGTGMILGHIPLYRSGFEIFQTNTDKLYMPTIS